VNHEGPHSFGPDVIPSGVTLKENCKMSHLATALKNLQKRQQATLASQPNPSSRRNKVL
jgi:hypothetical protein